LCRLKKYNIVKLIPRKAKIDRTVKTSISTSLLLVKGYKSYYAKECWYVNPEESMQKLSLDEIKAGMKLAKDVVLEDGRILLLRGFAIKPRYLNKLKAYKVPFIYVEDNITELEDISEERVYEDAFNNIKGIMESIRSDEKVDIVQLKETVNDMVHHILNDDMVFMTLTGIRDIDNYTFLHSVDVCIYSVVTAKALNMGHDEIYDLALAAILHDVGKCKVPLSILNKPGKLTGEEFEIMKRHSIYGY